MSKLNLRQLLHERMSESPEIDDWVVAYSGGADSSALLHLAADLSTEFKVRAIHINHGLNDEAQHWQRHSEAVCRSLNLELTVAFPNKALVNSGAGIEAAAREARYALFQEHLGRNSCLLLAHHADDQLETFLFRAFRGAGLEGLAAMPRQRSLGHAQLLRPLLSVPRSLLIEYLHKNNLEWIEDSSNSDISLDRNYIRQELLPRIRHRWPAAATVVARNSELLGDAAKLQERVAQEQLPQVCSDGVRLDLTELFSESTIDPAGVLRFWLCQQGFPVVSHARLTNLLDQIKVSAQSEQQLERVGPLLLKRYRQWLWVMPQVEAASQGWAQEVNKQETIALPDGLGEWSSTKSGRLCFFGSIERKAQWKKRFQALAVPKSIRDCFPVLTADGHVLAVANLKGWQLGIAEDLTPAGDSRVQWRAIPRWIACWIQ